MSEPQSDPRFQWGRILGAVSALGGGRLIGMVGSAVVSLFLTRQLPPAEYGALGIAFALQSLLMTVSLVGMRSAFLRELCLRPTEQPLVRASFLVTAAGIGWTAAAIGGVIITFLPLSADERRLYYLVLWSHVAAILELGPLFDAAGRQVSAAVIALFGDLLFLGGMGCLLYCDALTLPRIGLCLALRPWATLALQALWLPLGPTAMLGGSWAEARRLMTSGGWIGVAQAASIWPLTGSVFLVRGLAGKDDAGLYALAAHIAAAYLGISFVASRVTQPIVASPTWNDARYRRTTVRLFIAFVVGLGALAALGALLLFQFLFPAAYRGAREPALLLIAAAAAQGLAELPVIMLIQRHAERRVVVTWLLILPAAIGAAVWSASQSSIVGVAAAVLMGNLALLAAMTYGAVGRSAGTR